MSASSNVILNEMLGRRRDRAISIILNVKERECDKSLPREASQRLRKVILDQVNELIDFSMDICNSLDTGEVVLNEVYLQKLDTVYDILVNGNGNS